MSQDAQSNLQFAQPQLSRFMTHASHTIVVMYPAMNNLQLTTQSNGTQLDLWSTTISTHTLTVYQTGASCMLCSYAILTEVGFPLVANPDHFFPGRRSPQSEFVSFGGP